MPTYLGSVNAGQSEMIDSPPQKMAAMSGKLALKLRHSVVARRVTAFVWHIVGIALTYYLAFTLPLEFELRLPEPYDQVFLSTLPLALAIQLLVILAFRLYRGLWMYFGFSDCVKNVTAFGIGTAVLVVTVYLFNGRTFEDYPRSVFLSHYLMLLAWEIGGRVSLRLFRESRQGGSDVAKEAERVLVVGGTQESDQLLRSLNRQRGRSGRVVGVVTEEAHRRYSTLQGISVVGVVDNVGTLAAQLRVDMILILPPFTAPNTIKRIIKLAADENVIPKFRVVPTLADIARGDIDVSSIRRVEIEDLLNRDPYRVDLEMLRSFISGRSVMVTGAGGSIGSELCRQLLRLNPRCLVLFEASEYLLFKIERALCSSADGAKVIAYAGDIRREDQVADAINSADGVDLLFHAAAYKHVDLMERNPAACFHNNVVGTIATAGVAERLGVGHFVLISSDKAVRPTSLMGASKRIAERCIIERPASNTHFNAVRFGNVLGSSGSVVPIFREQIAAGGPVTVTSPDVTRYFMTIPEAVELVLMASAGAEDRNIRVLEMGEPVKIDTLARQMIELSGYVPDRDIVVEYTGLKSGEKEYEELITDDENVVATEHDRIWVLKLSGDEVAAPVDIGRLLELIDHKDGEGLRKYAQELIQDALLFRERAAEERA